MWIFMLLVSLLTVNSSFIKKECNGKEGYVLDDVFHELETLKENVDRPYLLTVDDTTNVVFFSYSIPDEEDSSRTARLNLYTKEFADIKGINNGFAQTVDPTTHAVYIGGSDGIYKYDYGQDRAEFYAERNLNIWNIYFKDVLYFSVYPSQWLYTYSNGRTERFKDLEDLKVDIFIIDNDNVLFYTNSTGLYSKIAGKNETVQYTEFTDYGVRGLALDTKGRVFACFQDGIYSVDKGTKVVEKVLDVDDAFGLAFDKDNNMVYSDSSRVLRLKTNKDIVC